MSIYHGVTPIVPESFLGGSAPRLRRLSLNHTPFPGLPNLLLSATHLVDLHLWRIPNSGYFTPEAIVTGLSTSTSLKVLWLGFESPLSRPKRERRRPPPLTRSILPALTRFRFKGSLLGGVAPVGTCPRSHWEVRGRATARRSPYNCFSVGCRMRSWKTMIDQ